jgi:hypothetical protein
MLGSDPEEGLSSTIGPKLENYLKPTNPGGGHMLRSQMPYYVLTKKKDEGETDKSVGNEGQEKDKDNEGGLFPMLLRSAKDDLKLVGNVIKYALA